MILLTTTTDKLQIITSATGTIDVHSSWIDLSAGVVTPGRTNTKITTATTTDIVAAPAASTTRNIKTVHISNNHATTSNTITFQYNENATLVPLESVTLLAGERLAYVEGVGCRIFDSTGREKLQTVAVSADQNTVTADQTISGVDAYITGSDFPVTGRLKVGSIVRWTITFAKTDVAGVATPIWVVRVGTAGAIGDTARCTMTGRAQTGATDTARVEISAHVRIFSSVGTLQGAMGGDHGLATTGISTGGFANQVLSGTHDLTLASTKFGISVNPGTSGVWVVKTCSVEGINLLA